jgi:NAD(P)-dependent dehydrogenase (short-subunit alcohol dehydrogenase family)
MELEGQVAIVTGAGRGIGRVTAIELARLGADIVVAELDRAGAERTAALVKGLGRRAGVVPTNVTSRADLAAMVERTRAEFGRIDVLVNNAGIYRAATPLDVTEEHWNAVISITKSLALAHAADGIRVNCVCPGFVETDMWTVVAREQGALLGLPPEEFTRQRAAQVPLGRMERPEDVAHVIAFLASSRAAYMTGQAISVDGGLVMH